jgi:N-acetylglucosamine-6-sulfatase
MLATVGVMLAAPTASAPAVAASTTGPPTPHDQPNIVLITTDDMRADDLRAMPYVRSFIGDQGVTATGISSHPLCCPARAQLLTGQYAHHNGVRTNSGTHGGYGALRAPDDTVAAWLADAGYATGFVGKFLNGYGEWTLPPAGWTSWQPFVKQTYQPYGVGVLGPDGVVTEKSTHSNDVVRDRTVATVRELAQGDEPFFVWSSYVAPHGTCEETSNCSDPPVPAERHRDRFLDATNPAESSRSFRNRRDSRVGRGATGRLRAASALRRTHVLRQQALASVDEGVAVTLATLHELGELDDTLVIFTSDNGYLLGEHGYEGKNVPYEEALRVPFLVRGPGVPVGVRRPGLTAALVDVAPTIAAAAGAAETRPGPLDGADLMPYLRGDVAPDSPTQLVDIGATPTFGTAHRPWSLRGVRTARYSYWVWANGRRQLFDRTTDSAQVRDLAGVRRFRGVTRELDRRLRLLVDCRGAAQCRRTFR